MQGIPAVKAFKDGKVVAEFTGAIPPPQVEQFFDSLVPVGGRPARRRGSGDDEDALRRALASDPRHLGAATALARLLLARGDNDEAAAVLEPFPGDFTAAGLAARAQLQRERDDLDDAWSAWDEGDHEPALEALQEAFAMPARTNATRSARRWSASSPSSGPTASWPARTAAAWRRRCTSRADSRCS